MKNRVQELKKLGYDILPIVENITHPKVLEEFRKFSKNQDCIIKPPSGEDIALFSEVIYRIVTKFKEKSEYGQMDTRTL